MRESNLNIEHIYNQLLQVKAEMKKVIVGQESMIDYLLIALLSHGHVLIEGVPGLAKTLTVKVLSKLLEMDYARIQFTPDLMPSDILGTSVFNFKTQEFQFKQGPIFANFILADEINRAPAKTQSALFEVMEERQISVDGNRYTFPYPFFIIATQNPIDMEGTYRLPEAQLDRFMFRIIVDYPSLEEEQELLQRMNSGQFNEHLDHLQPILNADQLRNMSNVVKHITIDDKILAYITNIVHASRHSQDIMVGGSPRASISMMLASKAMALLHGRDFVTPDDVFEVVVPVLAHRIILSPEREMEGKSESDVIASMIHRVEVPK